MFQPLGAVVSGPTITRASTPVRRQSRLAGRCEGVFWRKITKAEAWRVVYAAKKYELQERAAGSRRGPLGSVAIEILELFAHLVDKKTGRLEPSLEYLMRTLKRSKDAIHRALKALRAHGFLDWLRRYVPTGADTGPKVQQTSNAYRLSLPARAVRLLGRVFQQSPLPDDFSHARQEKAAQIEQHKASLSLAELPLFMIEDEALAASLSRMGAAIAARKERESVNRSESGN